MHSDEGKVTLRTNIKSNKCMRDALVHTAKEMSIIFK